VAAGQRTPGPLVVFSKTLPTGALPALSHSGRSMPTPRAIVASAVLVIVGTAFPGLLVGGLAPEIQADLALSRPALGLAVAVFWLAAAVASAPAGRFVDRFGPLRGIHVAGVLAALGALGVAAAGSTSFLIASLAVGGSANAFSTPGVSALASRAIPTERQGLAFGVQLAGPAIAALLAGLALPLLAGPVGWRATFAAAAILALASAATVPRVTTPRPQMDSRSDDRRLRPLLMLALGAAAANAAAGALLTFLVVYCIEVGLSSGSAGALLAAASGTAVAVRLALGLLADRRPDAELGWVVALLGLGATGYALVTTSVPALIAIGAILAVGLAWGWPGLLLLAVVRRHSGDPGAAVGIVVTGFFAGAVIGPLAAGPIAERASFELVWWLCAALALLAASSINAGRRMLEPAGGARPSVR
jgi:predicted MFS family arabinose efflux permease